MTWRIFFLTCLVVIKSDYRFTYVNLTNVSLWIRMDFRQIKFCIVHFLHSLFDLNFLLFFFDQEASLTDCSTDWLRQWASLGHWHLVDRPVAATCMALSSLDFKNGISNCQITPERVSLHNNLSKNGFQICEILKNMTIT